MATLRELKGRIGSVASSEKITGAMKMISSAKMHKAEQSLKKLKPYRSLIEDIIANLLSSDAEFTSPLTTTREVRKATIVVLGSDDGLCGAYNVNIFKQLIAEITRLRNNEISQEAEIEVIPVGNKMRKAVSKLKLARVKVVPTTKVNSKSEGSAVRDFLDVLRARFIDGESDMVAVLYMNFQSISRQRPRFDVIMPLEPTRLTSAAAGRPLRPCIFEPDAEEIFRSVIPMYLLSMLQEVFVENRASEQAARVMAMQSANDNAKKLLEQLRLEYNKLRQQSITTELLDIVGGQVR